MIGVLVLATGCATTPRKFNSLHLGMTKANVIDLLGEPRSVSAHSGTEYLNYTYNLGPISGMPAPGGAEEYYVRLVAGKVDSYGAVGDFDSTRKPETTINIRQQAPQYK